MKEHLGAWQVDDNRAKGRAQFKLFFPDEFDPQIKSIRVAGTFQRQISSVSNWDFEAGFPLQKEQNREGTLWTYTTEKELPAGYNQYKYLVTFEDGTKRKVSDPCTRYGGTDNQNAAFVIGGSRPKDNPIAPLLLGRKPIRDLIIYELNLDDFTREFRRGRAPFAALVPGEISDEKGEVSKLDYLAKFGINAILFMPWTAWRDRNFDWGYQPFQYFAVEYRYANDAAKPNAITKPEEKISWLKKLISECHNRNIQVIMDGVFQHVSPDFPYKQFYLNQDICPYTGAFGEHLPGLQELNFNNKCTQEFIRDVCLYWIENFKIDGIRFDYTKGYYLEHETKGLPSLLEDIQNYLDGVGEKNFSLIIEHLDMDAAKITNETEATSYWDNGIHDLCFEYLKKKQIDPRIVNAFNNDKYLNSEEKAATIYLTNHDHSQVAWQAGSKSEIVNDEEGSMKWYKTQPYAIALFCCPGVPLIQNGQEFGEDYWIPENDGTSGRRIIPRPLRWKLLDDAIGSNLYRLYSRLMEIRKSYPGLRSRYFSPQNWEEWQSRFNLDGVGVDTEKQVVIFRREGKDNNGVLQRFIIVLNFSDNLQHVTVQFPVNGTWIDLLNEPEGSWRIEVKDSGLDLDINSNWGRILFK